MNEYNQALNLFNIKSYNKAFDVFLGLDCLYECGYCKFLLGDIDAALNFWKQDKIDSPAINWGLNLIDIVQLTVPTNLTFFQIRNFLERDMQLLFETGQLKMLENIMSACDILAEFNPESYKFIGRVLLNNGYFDLSNEFLQKALMICYSDCEVHFLLAQYYLFKQEFTEAKKILKKSIKINSGYFPAKKLLAEIQ